MLRRITDLWPNLIRRVQGDDEEEEDRLLGPGEQESDDDPEDRVDEGQLLENFRHLFWTRLMKIDGYEEGQDRKFPMGPDIVEECRAVSNLQPVDEEQWTPLFDPDGYNKAHGPLLVQDHTLPQADLKRWADRLRATSWEHAFVFFKHEDEAAGPRMAEEFKALFDD